MTAVVEHSSVERQMLDAIGESVMATDADGRVTYTNQAAADAFRASTDELIGRSVHELLTPTASRRELHLRPGDPALEAAQEALGEPLPPSSASDNPAAADTYQYSVTAIMSDGTTATWSFDESKVPGNLQKLNAWLGAQF